MSLLIYKFTVTQFSFLSLSYLCCCSGVAGFSTCPGKQASGDKRGKAFATWCQARKAYILVPSAGNHASGVKRGKTIATWHQAWKTCNRWQAWKHATARKLLCNPEKSRLVDTQYACCDWPEQSK